MGGREGDIYGRRFLWMGWMDAAVLGELRWWRDNVVVFFDRSYSRADEMDEAMKEAELSLRSRSSLFPVSSVRLTHYFSRGLKDFLAPIRQSSGLDSSHNGPPEPGPFDTFTTFNSFTTQICSQNHWGWPFTLWRTALPLRHLWRRRCDSSIWFPPPEVDLGEAMKRAPFSPPIFFLFGQKFR